MMLYGLDCLNPPSDEQGKVMLKLGWTFLNVYIGGPYLSGHTPWPAQRTSALGQLGLAFLPLYVGVQNTGDMHGVLTFHQGILDGAEALKLLELAGLSSSPIVGFDFEAGNYQRDPAGTRGYLEGLVSVANQANYQAVLYSDPLTAAELGTPDLVDWTWVSDPVTPGRLYRVAPRDRFDPNSDPPWSAWQFAFGATIAGINCDLNSAVDTFPLARLPSVPAS